MITKEIRDEHANTRWNYWGRSSRSDALAPSLEEGIDAVVLESRSREEVESTIRAGVLEQGTADLLTEMGLGERMKREGALHQGIELRFDGK